MRTYNECDGTSHCAKWAHGRDRARNWHPSEDRGSTTSAQNPTERSENAAVEQENTASTWQRMRSWGFVPVGGNFIITAFVFVTTKSFLWVFLQRYYWH